MAGHLREFVAPSRPWALVPQKTLPVLWLQYVLSCRNIAQSWSSMVEQGLHVTRRKLLVPFVARTFISQCWHSELLHIGADICLRVCECLGHLVQIANAQDEFMLERRTAALWSAKPSA